jgi:hypothetical protein
MSIPSLVGGAHPNVSGMTHTYSDWLERGSRGGLGDAATSTRIRNQLLVANHFGLEQPLERPLITLSRHFQASTIINAVMVSENLTLWIRRRIAIRLIN